METGQLIREIALKTPELVIRLGKVISVDTDRTCTVELIQDSYQITDVLIQAINKQGSGFYIQPSVNSLVMVVLNEMPFICLSTDFESLELGGNQYGGLTKVHELKKQLDKTHALLEAMLKVFNGTPVPEPGNGSPSAFQTLLKTALAGQQLGSFEELENEKVTHG